MVVAVDSALRRRQKLKCENVATLIFLWGCPLIIVRDLLILIWDLQELIPLIWLHKKVHHYYPRYHVLFVTSRAVAARFNNFMLVETLPAPKLFSGLTVSFESSTWGRDTLPRAKYNDYVYHSREFTRRTRPASSVTRPSLISSFRTSILSLSRPPPFLTHPPQIFGVRHPYPLPSSDPLFFLRTRSQLSTLYPPSTPSMNP
jgi:hypothetical protein